MTAEVAIALVPKSTVSTSSVGANVVLGADRFYASCYLDIDDYLGALGSGITVSVETAWSASGGWAEIYNSGLLSAKGAQQVKLIGCRERLRARWVLTGTPVLSFSLLGTSHQTYCNNQDLSDLAIPNVALGDIVPEVRANACLVASDEAASYLGQDHDMPLQSWGNALRLHTANMAVYHLMKRRGFNPEADEIIRLGYTDAIAWLKSGARTDKSIVDTTPEATSNAAYMVSRPARGWSHR